MFWLPTDFLFFFLLFDLDISDFFCFSSPPKFFQKCQFSSQHFRLRGALSVRYFPGVCSSLWFLFSSSTFSSFYTLFFTAEQGPFALLGLLEETPSRPPLLPHPAFLSATRQTATSITHSAHTREEGGGGGSAPHPFFPSSSFSSSFSSCTRTGGAIILRAFWTSLIPVVDSRRPHCHL